MVAFRPHHASMATAVADTARLRHGAIARGALERVPRHTRHYRGGTAADAIDAVRRARVPARASPPQLARPLFTSRALAAAFAAEFAHDTGSGGEPSLIELARAVGPRSWVASARAAECS